MYISIVGSNTRARARVIAIHLDATRSPTIGAFPCNPRGTRCDKSYHRRRRDYANRPGDAIDEQIMDLFTVHSTPCEMRAELGDAWVKVCGESIVPPINGDTKNCRAPLSEPATNNLFAKRFLFSVLYVLNFIVVKGYQYEHNMFVYEF